MDIDQLIDLEVRVRELIESLEKEIEEADAHVAPPGKLDGTEGRLSRQDSMMHHEIAKDAQRRRAQRLQLLQEAVERIDAGTYGLCEGCGGEIEFGRLDVVPEAIRCGRCAGS